MDLKELEEETKEFDGSEESSEGDAEEDIFEAISLLSKCHRLMAFMSDTGIIKQLNKRDRAIMWQVSQEVRQYLDAVEGTYVE
jgi:hypothetical protein